VTHRVVANDEGQHSLWPGHQELPAGWTATGFAGSEAECLDHIEQAWTALSPQPVPAGAGTNTLGTPRLIVRELTAGQVARVLAADAAAGEWAADYPPAGSGFAARHFLERAPGELRPGFGMYQIARRSDGLAVGDLGFHRPPVDGAAEIGFGLAESGRGHGYATEALTELTRWAFTQPGVSRITARTEPSNVPSQGVLDRAGFRLERTAGDVLHYVLLPLAESEPMRDDDAEFEALRVLGEIRKAGGDDLAFVPGTDPLRRVVRDGGRLLAYAQSGEKEGVEDPVDYLMYIVVHPDVARRGLATGLLGEILDHARAHGRAGLVTGTHDEDAAAVAWVRKHGFKEIGRHRITRREPGAATAGAPAGLETGLVDRADSAAVGEFVALATATIAEAVMPGGARMTADPAEIRTDLVEDGDGPLVICRAAGRAAGWMALTPLGAGADGSVLGLQVLEETAGQGVPAALLAAAARLADESGAALMAVAEVDGQRELAAVMRDYGFRKVAGRTIWCLDVDSAPASG
jgi:RimJ/RimL family protein N-acetyltransferase